MFYYTMLGISYGIYKSSWVYISYKTNTKQYNLYSPDPAVSCVTDTPVSDLEKQS